MPEPLRTYDPLNPPTLTSLRNRALAYQNPALLAEKGVTFAFTTEGLNDPERLLRNIRIAIANGLPKEKALEALTLIPARLLKVDDRLGTLEQGKLASFVVTQGELFEPRTRIRYLFIEGKQYKIDDTPQTASAPPAPRFRRPRDWDAENSTSLHEASCCYHHAETGVLVHMLSHDHLAGACDADCTEHLTAGVPPSATPLHPARSFLQDVPAPEPQPQETSERTPSQGAPSGDDLPVLPRVKLTPIMPTPPDEHNTWLIRNATVWTLTHDKPLPNTDVLIVDGIIRAVGKNLQAPPNARVIDATGKHLTPGIIDCHSHTAINGGVNEGTNVCTAEVRIEDVLNPDDVNIYRQLAGGVTGALVLHGSANVIGGQSATVKWRWGKSARDMLFAEAPSGIKFALGENVKRSNFRTTGPTRYPASRMGVEQVIHDTFLQALDYKRHWEEYRVGKRPYPPARNLQLDAIVEILEGKRLMHCHSYRQDEILILLRVCEEFGVRVGTLQHVLEGYKVANEIAQHGRGTITGPDPLPPDGVAFTLILRQEGNTLSGTLETLLGTQSFSGVPFDPSTNTIQITLEVQGMSFTVNATVEGDRMTGTITAMGMSFNLQAQRVP